MTMEVKLGFKKLHPAAKLPKYAHDGDAGMDVCAVESGVIFPKDRALVKTGLCAEIPHGYEIQVRSRSGLALKQGVFVLNSPGTVDENYRGEIGVILTNLGNSDFKFEQGDRIAQLVLSPVTRAETFEVEEVSETERGSGGFGSTGV